MKTISNKDPAEAVIVTFDFSSDGALAYIETISNPIITIAPKGDDPSAENMLYGLPQQDGYKIMQKVTGGLAGLDYVISATVETSAGQRLKLSGVLPVRVHA